MDRSDVALIVVGLGITFGFMAFLAYLFASGRRGDTIVVPLPPEQQPREVCVPPSCPPVVTEERRPNRPHIVNHILNTANTWYEIAIPNDIRAWKLKTRGIHKLNYSFNPSHSTYMTLEKGTVIDSDTSPGIISYPAIYVSSEDEATVVEMEIWR